MSLLRIDNTSKHFGGVKAVDQCQFRVEGKSITAVVGPNGAGKTTVFQIVAGLLEADSGTIVFRGKDLTHQAAWQRARAGISRTFQLSRLFRNLTVEENLLLALRQDDHQLWSMLRRGPGVRDSERAQIREVMKRVGLDVDLATLVTDLSYGQQKLFDLCRGLIHPHTFLMLDEPVAGVNPVLREKFKGILKELKAAGETILLIEHDMDFVRSVADRVIVMDQGKVLAEGEPEEVLRDPRVLDAYLGMTL